MLMLVAVTMVTLMGFSAMAVDYGLLVNDRNRLQRACDAAALAGAQELKLTGNDTTDTANATTVAIATAGQNGVTIYASDISFSHSNADITVPARLTRNLFFARVLGITTGSVAATATAGVTPTSGGYTPYVAPVGITTDTYNTYLTNTDVQTLSLIRHNKNNFEFGDFVLFDLSPSNGKSPAKMVSQLTGGETDLVTIGSYQTALNASLKSEGAKFLGGVNTLISRAEGSPWYDCGSSQSWNGKSCSSTPPSGLTWYQQMQQGSVSYSDPRVIYLIVSPPVTTNPGTLNALVETFIPVYIESYDNSTGLLSVRFLPAQSMTDGQTGFLTGTNGNAVYGARIVQLLD